MTGAIPGRVFGQRIGAATRGIKETVCIAFGAFEASRAPVDATTKATILARIIGGRAKRNGGTASLAGGRTIVWDKNYVVVELTVGELLASSFGPCLDKLPPSFSGRVAPVDDVGGDLRRVGGVLMDVGLDGGDAFAHRFEQGHVLVVRVLVSFSKASVIRIVVCREICQLIDEDVPVRSAPAVGLHPVNVGLHLRDNEDATALLGVQGGVDEPPDVSVGTPAILPPR